MKNLKKTTMYWQGFWAGFFVCFGLVILGSIIGCIIEGAIDYWNLF